MAFSKKYSYALKTPLLSGESIKNPIAVAQKVSQHPDWNHGKYYFAWKVLGAEEFTFLGSNETNSRVKFSGKGSAILNFLTLGLAGNLSKTGNVSVEVVGTGDDVAIALARVKRNGQIDFA